MSRISLWPFPISPVFLLPNPYGSYFSRGRGQVHKGQLKEGGFILAHSQRAQSVRMGRTRQWEQLLTVVAEVGGHMVTSGQLRKRRECPCSARFLLFTLAAQALAYELLLPTFRLSHHPTVSPTWKHSCGHSRWASMGMNPVKLIRGLTINHLKEGPVFTDVNMSLFQ